MNVARPVGAAVVVAFSTFAIYHFSWQPLHCDLVKRAVQTETLREWKRRDQPATAPGARERLAKLQRCLSHSPTDADMYMTVALNDRMLGRHEHAVAMYHEALRYARRPEIFFNLGIVYLEMNQRQTAIAPLTQAVAFEMNYAQDIPDITVRDQVLAAVELVRSGNPQ